MFLFLIGRDMLRMGASRPWPDALEAVTGVREMSALPVIEYFRPLMEWLAQENAGETIGWAEECPAGIVIGGSA
jgi:peptidyl-dipeptidase A